MFKKGEKEKNNMTVLEVLKMVSLYLNLYDNFQPLFNGEELSQEDNLEFQKILSGINLTAKSLSGIYKLKVCEEILLSDNSFNLSLLQKPLSKICCLKNQFGKKQNFNVINNTLKTNFCGKAIIEYFYLPPTVQTVEDIIEINNCVSLKTFCMGVISEYCYINNLFDDAFVWEERFNKSLNTKFLSSVFSMPSKRWL